MPDRILEQALSGKVDGVWLPWPDRDEITVQLVDGAFLPGTAVRLTLDCVWDNPPHPRHREELSPDDGLFHYVTTFDWSGGSKGVKTGGSPFGAIAFTFGVPLNAKDEADWWAWDWKQVPTGPPHVETTSRVFRPDHYRVSLEPTRGVPVVGVR